MKLFHSLEAFKIWSAHAVISFGNFDGCHLAHQHLLGRLRATAKAKKLPAMVVCFEPQPQEWLQVKPPPRLSTWEEKQRLFAKQAIDAVVCLPFNQQLASCSAQDFVEKILLGKLGMQGLVVGHDVRFGYKRLGDRALLAQLAGAHQFDLEVLPSYQWQGQRVSSTAIRQALAMADFKMAKQLLGRPFTMQGYVIKGQGQAKAWGWPTANIRLNRQISPLRGVFVVQVTLPSAAPQPGIANIGHRPTVDGQQWLLEVHMLNFQGHCYNQWVEVEFLQKFRDEKKFATIPDLITQINRDVAEAKAYFAADQRVTYE